MAPRHQLGSIAFTQLDFRRPDRWPLFMFHYLWRTTLDPRAQMAESHLCYLCTPISSLLAKRDELERGSWNGVRPLVVDFHIHTATAIGEPSPQPAHLTRINQLFAYMVCSKARVNQLSAA